MEVQLAREAPPMRQAPLTPRELTMLECAVQDPAAAQAAFRLGLSPQTVKNYTSQVLRKLRVDGRTAAVVIALQRGWLDLHALDVWRDAA